MKSNRTVGLLLPNFTLGGAEGQAVELALRLPARGWRPVVLTAEAHGPLGERMREAGLPFHDLGAEMWRSKKTTGFWWNLARTVSRISSLCRRERVSVLQSFLYWQNQLAIPAALVTPGVRVITGRRNTGEFKDRRRHYQTIENVTNRWSDLIVCNAEMVRRDVLARERVRRDRVRVIYNGVDVERFATAPAMNLRARFPELAKAPVIVGTVGNMKRQKRHDVFLRSLADVRREVPDVGGIVVGRDLGEEQGLRALARELGIEHAVAFAGGVGDPAPLLRAMDVFVLTSDHEGMPNVVLEAMSAGAPVVATDAGGVREIIRDGVTGTIIPRGDHATAAHAVVELLRHPEQWKEQVQRARDSVRTRFSLEAMVEQHVQLYEELTR